MKRVTSRQRLVSWDAFDASAPYHSSSDDSVDVYEENPPFVNMNYDDIEDFESCHEDIDSFHEMINEQYRAFVTTNDYVGDNQSNSKRKRNDRRCASCSSSSNNTKSIYQQQTPTVFLDEEVSLAASICEKMKKATVVPNSPCTSTPPTFEALPEDMQINIYSYLDLPSWTSIMSTCKSQRRLFLESDDAMLALWIPYANRNYHWDLLAENKKNSCTKGGKKMTSAWSQNQKQPVLDLSAFDHIVDDIHLSPAYVSRCGSSTSNNLNLSLLWSMGQIQPQKVDVKEFEVDTSALTLRARLRMRMAAVGANIAIQHIANAANAVVMAVEHQQQNPHRRRHRRGARHILHQTHRRRRQHHHRIARHHTPIALAVDADDSDSDVDVEEDDDIVIGNDEHENEHHREMHSLLLQYSQVQYQNDLIDVVQFRGQVGVGDRCIRGNAPLPRPKLRTPCGKIIDTEQKWSELPYEAQDEYNTGGNRALFDFFCRSAKAVVKGVSSSTLDKSCWRPFVASYKTQNYPDRLHLTPRYVSYFEITILDPRRFQNNKSAESPDIDSATAARGQPRGNNHNGPQDPHLLIPRTRRLDCIAVGLATRNFQMHTRMPGWDVSSYGYHGDDGGIFHNSGGMLRKFGPKFGHKHGDTIGCGIDYIEQGIFFTVNGEMIGYAWKNLSLKMLSTTDFFPVVGIDSNDFIYCNFDGGERPFEFDLTSMILPHETLIKKNYDTATPANTVITPVPMSGSRRRADI